MPTPPTPSKTQLDKRRFIHRMGPYFRQARAEGLSSEAQFLKAIWTQYCNRWPVNARDYLDLDIMQSHMDVKRQELHLSVEKWAGLSAFEAEMHWSQLFHFQEAAAANTGEHAKLGSKENPIDVDGAITLPPLQPRTSSSTSASADII
ncbi:hypothetical protein HYPSUDRAFT_200648 [Hypholoma sublateritium FD-334 SS-4]|uniref:Uncharacterized protein n=1 Tax=Hypholoma sublateritium (strain FD-334 SS-4) TaxID=945553 RepID=A0A0D2PYF0_HYPSF|nr:hypothetical protein HYPSUDRAFT_200648 [Hypholoma sublateritium FD-334 SS-4]